MVNKKIKFCLEINNQIWKKFKIRCIEENKKLGQKIEELIKKDFEK